MQVLINATKVCKKNEHQFVTFLETLLSFLIEKNTNITFRVVTTNNSIELKSLNCKTENITVVEKQNILTQKKNKLKINKTLCSYNYDVVISINDINFSETKKQICILNSNATQIQLNKKEIKAPTDIIAFTAFTKNHFQQLENEFCRLHQLNQLPIIPFIATSYTDKMQIKDGYADGREYFLYDANSTSTEDIINLLKSFSIFKKWQHSSMKLLILLNSFTSIESLQIKLETYKYKDDVRLIQADNNEILSNLISASYCFITYCSNTQFPIYISHAIENKVAVICGNDEFHRECFQDTIMYAEKNNINSLADKMKIIYKDENLKQELQSNAYKKQSSINKDQIIQSVEKIIFQNTN